MKISWDKVINVALRYLPQLIMLAEGLFNFKEKSGDDKKAFVSNSIKTVIDVATTESTGGQAETWEDMHDSVDNLIDSAVEVMNRAGAFRGPIVSDRGDT